MVATMTNLSTSSRAWDGQTGLVTGELVKGAVGALPAPIFYVVGPPAMVEAMRGTLNRTGVDDDDIRSEDFYGY
jgi:Na+-transporting NADH:ubiquinone oxidoreductase subunit NqrF